MKCTLDLEMVCEYITHRVRISVVGMKKETSDDIQSYVGRKNHKFFNWDFPLAII